MGWAVLAWEALPVVAHPEALGSGPHWSLVLSEDSLPEWAGPGWATRGVQKIQKLSETPATVHKVAKLCINDSKNRKNHEKLVQPVAPHLCMNPKPQKWPISKMSQTY